jgi:hypothetical protein
MREKERAYENRKLDAQELTPVHADRATLADAQLSRSMLSFRLGLARQRTLNFPMPSLDFAMMDLERPPATHRHAEHCVGDLSGRLLEF